MLLIELINTRTHIPDTCFRFVETAVFSFFHDADETVTPSIIFYIILYNILYNTVVHMS